ncbi:hypothetical protein Scep_001682 [Stephania cephalantha]|uniref:Uncharacterized protein n=1 Tax=Stephania cephalantha TaxID=152367 RepID=A0AAP0L8P2_9MAGN
MNFTSRKERTGYAGVRYENFYNWVMKGSSGDMERESFPTVCDLLNYFLSSRSLWLDSDIRSGWQSKPGLFSESCHIFLLFSYSPHLHYQNEQTVPVKTHGAKQGVRPGKDMVPNINVHNSSQFLIDGPPSNFSDTFYCLLAFVSLIVFGAIVAGAQDLSFDYYSYGVVFICNLSSAIYVTTVAHYGDDLQLSFIPSSQIVVYKGKDIKLCYVELEQLCLTLRLLLDSMLKLSEVSEEGPMYIHNLKLLIMNSWHPDRVALASVARV